MNKFVVSIMLSSLYVTSVCSMSKSQRKAQEKIEKQQKAKEAAAETSVVSTIVTTVIDDQNIQAQQKSLIESTDDQNVKPQQTQAVEEERKKQDDEQQQKSSSALQVKRAAHVALLKAKIVETAPKPAVQQEPSLGTRVDSWWTKVTDNIWGHASNVTDDILNDRITKNADTNGLHRIDRAIDEHIAADNQKGLIELINACAQKEILIPIAHIQKAEAYFTELEEKTRVTKFRLCTMQELYIVTMKPAIEHADGDDFEVDDEEKS